MIVARKEEEWNFGKKKSSSSLLFVSWERYSFTIDRFSTLPTSINLWKIFHDNRLNDTASPFVERVTLRLLLLHTFSAHRKICSPGSINQKKKAREARWDSTYNKQTPFNHNRHVTILPYRVPLLTIWYLSNNPLNQSTILSWKQCRRSVNEKPITVPKWCMQLTMGKLFPHRAPILIRPLHLSNNQSSPLFRSHRCIYISLKCIKH